VLRGKLCENFVGQWQQQWGHNFAAIQILGGKGRAVRAVGGGCGRGFTELGTHKNNYQRGDLQLLQQRPRRITYLQHGCR